MSTYSEDIPISPRSRHTRALRFSCDLLQRLQKRFSGEHHVFPTLDEPPLPDNPLHINQEEGPLWDPELGQRLAGGSDAVMPSHLQVRPVAEDRVRQMERLRKRLLRKGMVGADRENLDVQF